MRGYGSSRYEDPLYGRLKRGFKINSSCKKRMRRSWKKTARRLNKVLSQKG